MANLPASDECHFKVTVSFEPQKEEETFVSMDKAKEYAADRIMDDDVVKVTIKKIEPDENDDSASDGERVQE